MKKYLILAASAVLVLAACAKVEKFQNTNEENAILFGAYSGKAAITRANPIPDVKELAAQGGFGVFAYYTGNAAYSASATPNFMYNQAVTSSDEGANWVYSPIKYWPNNDSNTTNGSATWTDKLSFFAYAPYVAATVSTGATANTVGITEFKANTAAGDPTVKYVVATDPAESVDFLYNDAALKDLTKQAVTGKVTFNFKHALTRLAVTVQGVFDSTTAPSSDDVDANTKIYVESLDITTTSNIPAYGVFNLNTKAWDTTGAPAATLEIGNNIPAALQSPNAGVTKTEVSLIKPDANDNPQYFMFIPNDSAQEYNFNIVYKVITTDANLAGGKSEITNDITKKASIKFEAGKSYTIKLELGMTTVKLAATVEDWTDAADQDPIWLPINQ